MKSFLGLLTIALLIFCQDTLAQHGPGYRPGWRRPPHRTPTVRRPRHRYPRYGRRHPGYTTVTCAPEVVASNLERADQVLGQLAAGELKSNATFTARIAEVAAISSSQEKTESYLALAGVDADNAEDVLNFLYSREVVSENIEAAQENLGLTAEQAQIVINKLTEALKPL